jgi:hypothetical protein
MKKNDKKNSLAENKKARPRSSAASTQNLRMVDMTQYAIRVNRRPSTGSALNVPPPAILLEN